MATRLRPPDGAKWLARCAPWLECSLWRFRFRWSCPTSVTTTNRTARGCRPAPLRPFPPSRPWTRTRSNKRSVAWRLHVTTNGRSGPKAHFWPIRHLTRRPSRPFPPSRPCTRRGYSKRSVAWRPHVTTYGRSGPKAYFWPIRHLTRRTLIVQSAPNAITWIDTFYFKGDAFISTDLIKTPYDMQ